MTPEAYAAEAGRRFRAGCNCAQAVFCTFAAACGIEEADAVRMASSFGGGMGRLREVCGCVSGMLLAAGILYASEDPTDQAAKTAHYRRVQELAEAFRAEHGSIVCRELLGLPDGRDSFVPEKRTEAYYRKRPCGELAADAARIFGAYLAAHEPPNRKDI